MTIRTILVLYVCSVLIAKFAEAQACQTCDAQISEAVTAARFLINTDQTVTDKQTGLTWKRCTQGKAGETCSGTATQLSLQQAMAAAQSETFANQTDWRLPNIRELSSIVEGDCRQPAINLRAFPNTDASFFWSSSILYSSDSDAWIVSFDTGNGYYVNRSSIQNVRLVRGESFQ